MFTNIWYRGILITVVALAAGACSRNAVLQDGVDVAAEPTATWTRAFNAGDATALAALYAENARFLPPGGPVIAGRSSIEAYWRDDMGEGEVTTALVPVDAVAQGDLVQVEGTYQVEGAGGNDLASGQYQQLWTRSGSQWLVRREMWRIDPALHRETDLAARLTSSWTVAYNTGDPKTLLALYADDAALSTVQEGTIEGKPAIEAFWVGDFGATRPSSALTLTDAYVVGELAHLEGDYKVTDSGKVTDGRFIQLWMRDEDGWKIHREMWWR